MKNSQRKIFLTHSEKNCDICGNFVREDEMSREWPKKLLSGVYPGDYLGFKSPLMGNFFILMKFYEKKSLLPRKQL